MARPRSFSDESVRKAHASTDSTMAMAKVLGVSTVCAYKHIKRLGLTPKASEGRPDLRLFTDDEFLAAYENANSLPALAVACNCSIPTARKHMIRLSLEGFGHRVMTEDKCLRLFNSYQGDVTVRNLVVSYNVSAGTVRNSFDRVIRKLWSSSAVPQPTLPMPDCHGQIKVYNLLRKHPKAANKKSAEIATQIKVPPLVVERYLVRALRSNQTP